MGSAPTESRAAHVLYLQAEAIEKAGAVKSRLYRRALEIDPTFAEARAALAAAYLDWAWSRGWDRVLAGATRQAAEQALALDPRLADAHLELGDAYRVLGNTERQLEAYRRAWDLRPEPGMANNLIVLLDQRGSTARNSGGRAECSGARPGRRVR